MGDSVKSFADIKAGDICFMTCSSTCHKTQISALHRTTPESHPVPETIAKCLLNSSTLGAVHTSQGACSSAQLLCGWKTFFLISELNLLWHNSMPVPIVSAINHRKETLVPVPQTWGPKGRLHHPFCFIFTKDSCAQVYTACRAKAAHVGPSARKFTGDFSAGAHKGYTSTHKTTAEWADNKSLNARGS